MAGSSQDFGYGAGYRCAPDRASTAVFSSQAASLSGCGAGGTCRGGTSPSCHALLARLISSRLNRPLDVPKHLVPRVSRRLSRSGMRSPSSGAPDVACSERRSRCDDAWSGARGRRGRRRRATEDYSAFIATDSGSAEARGDLGRVVWRPRLRPVMIDGSGARARCTNRTLRCPHRPEA